MLYRMHQMTQNLSLIFFTVIYILLYNYMHSMAANREASYNIIIVRLDILSELSTKKSSFDGCSHYKYVALDGTTFERGFCPICRIIKQGAWSNSHTCSHLYMCLNEEMGHYFDSWVHNLYISTARDLDSEVTLAHSGIASGSPANIY